MDDVLTRTEAVSAAERQARIDLAAAYRLCDRMAFGEGICNHLSLSVPGAEGRFLLIPYGQHWSEVTASSLIVVDARGNTVAGDGFVERTAFYIHAAVHQARVDAKCVLHSHLPSALALCMIKGGRLQATSLAACRFHERIAYDDGVPDVAFDWPEAERMAAAFGADKIAMFNANHGVVVVGDTVAVAFDRLYYLHRACQAQVMAMATGRPLRVIPDARAEEIASAIEAEHDGDAGNPHRHFAALKRTLDRAGSDYAD